MVFTHQLLVPQTIKIRLVCRAFNSKVPQGIVYTPPSATKENSILSSALKSLREASSHLSDE